MTSMTFFASIFLFLSIPDDTNELLMELRARSVKASDTLAVGSAVYAVERTVYSPDEKPFVARFNVTSYFDCGNRAYASGQMKLLERDQELWVFDTDPHNGAEEKPAPEEYRVVVENPHNSDNWQYMISPRLLGFMIKDGGQFYYLDQIAQMLKESDSVSVKRDGDLITFTRKRENGRIEVTFDAVHGYGLKSLKKWGVGVPNVPYIELENEFKMIDGCPVVSKQTYRSRVLENQGSTTHRLVQARTIRLVRFSKAKPEPTTFSDKWLGVKDGARVHDQRSGRQYVYGMDGESADDCKTGINSGNSGSPPYVD